MRNPLVHFLMALVVVCSISPHAAIADDNGPVIVHLAFRDHIVTISSSPEGPRYSVRTRSGRLLGESLTEQQLLAEHPQLHRRIRSGYATDEPGSFVWAGRDEQWIEPPVNSTIESE